MFCRARPTEGGVSFFPPPSSTHAPTYGYNSFPTISCPCGCTDNPPPPPYHGSRSPPFFGDHRGGVYSFTLPIHITERLPE